MPRVIELRPINEIINQIRQDYEERTRNAIASIEKDCREKIERIEQNRQAFALLDGAGFELELYDWMNGHWYDLDLGFFPSTKAGNAALAAKLNLIRRVLECPLRKHGHDIADCKKRHIQVALKPALYPGITVRYQRKLARHAKCRIVRQVSRYSTLVCER